MAEMPIDKLRQYLRELTPEARALLATELERALARGDNPPGAAMILEELRGEARESGRKMPPRVVNPRTNQTYVLLPAELYERVRAVLEDEDDIAAVRETYPAVGSVLDGGNSTLRKYADGLAPLIEHWAATGAGMHCVVDIHRHRIRGFRDQRLWSLSA